MNFVRRIPVENLQNEAKKAVCAAFWLVLVGISITTFSRNQRAPVSLGLEKFFPLQGNLSCSFRMNMRVWFLYTVLSFELRYYCYLFKVSHRITKDTSKRKKALNTQMKLKKKKAQGMFIKAKDWKEATDCQCCSNVKFSVRPSLTNLVKIVNSTPAPFLLYFSPWYLLSNINIF